MKHEPRATNDASWRTSLLESVLARAMELRDEGRPDWLEVACQECPELLDAVREAAGGAEAVSSYFRDFPADGSDADPALGLTLGGRFRLLRRIGSGAMGVVYAAEDRLLVRTVAVKVLRPGLTAAENAGQRFAREASAMASVQHPAVVTIHDRGWTDGREPFLVMEWIDGMPLDEIIEAAARRSAAGLSESTDWLERECGIDPRGESSWLRLVVRWIAELAAGVETVHGAGVLHRDIKPSNVIVRRSGLPVLLDFGIALLDDDSTLTRGATSVGTPAYLPPEVLARGRHRSALGDVYSLTATLYHLITLRAPYQGTPSEVLTAIATRDPAPASRHRRGLPRDLQAILEKGMHRRPHARYASAAALEADLRAFLDHRPVVARPSSAWGRAARATLRSKMAAGAALALGMVLIAGATIEIRRQQRVERQARAFELERRLPPTFLVGRNNRVYRYEADRARVERLLDDAVAVGGDPIRMRLLRASFRLDHGDAAGAASDMRALAEQLDSPFARALAGRYAALAPDARGHGALDLERMPEAESPSDVYLRAYHLLRSGDERAAHGLLSDDAVRRIAHAEELRLACTPFDGNDSAEHFARALAAYYDTLRLEARLGGRTASTALIAGRMLDIVNRYEEALDVLDEGIALADRAYTLRINAGFAAYALGRLDEARAHLELAVDLRPNYRKPLQDLVWVLIEQGEFDEALRRIEQAPLDEIADTAQWRLLHRSGVETYRALEEKLRGEVEASRASVQRAVALRDSAKALGDFRHGADLAILQGLLEDREESIFLGLAALLAEDPHHWWRLTSLLQNMPDDLSPAASRAVRGVLESLARRLESRPPESDPPGVSGN